MKSYIVSNPGVLGGTPVLLGTRIPMSRIIFLLKDGYNIEAIANEYPHVDKEIISKAIDELVVKLNKTSDAKKFL